MKYSNLSFNDHKKFQAIADEILSDIKNLRENQLVFSFTYSDLKESVRSAKYCNKINNQSLKSEHYDNNIKTISGLDKLTGKVVHLALRPHKRNTTKQLFIYEVLNKQYASIQEYRHFTPKN